MRWAECTWIGGKPRTKPDNQPKGWSMEYPEGTNPRWKFQDEFGSVTLERHSPYSHVAGLRVCVRPEHRRQGHGRRLIREALKMAPKIKLARVEATPYVDNFSCANLFVSLPEFEYEGVRRKAGRRGNDLVDTYLYAWTL